MSGAEILALPMKPNDADAATVRDYLKALLATLIEKEEGFSGKRPFGNSGWMSDLQAPLVQAGVVPGSLDSEGWLDACDDKAAATAIQTAIEAM